MRRFLALSLALSLSGCALGVTPVADDYHPAKGPPACSTSRAAPTAALVGAAVLGGLAVTALAATAGGEDDGFYGAVDGIGDAMNAGVALGALVPAVFLGVSAGVAYGNASGCERAHAAHNDWLQQSRQRAETPAPGL